MTGPSAVTDQGKLWAALSYLSFFVGLPIGVIPLLQRGDAYALYHAKHATAVWLAVFGLTLVLSVVYMAVSFVTCGFGAILFPLVLLPMPWAAVVGIHGLVLSINGEWKEPLGVFGLGDMAFGQIQLKTPAELQGPPPPPPPPPSAG